LTTGADQMLKPLGVQCPWLDAQYITQAVRGYDVFGAAMRLLPGYTEDWVKTPFYEHDATSQIVSAAMFVAACVYVWVRSTRQVKEA